MRTPAIIGVALILAGCASTLEDFVMMPSPILCRQVEEYSKVRYYYQDALYDYHVALAELNKRGEDCSKYLGGKTTTKIK